MRRFRQVVAALLCEAMLVVMSPTAGLAYSVLTHEQMIDLAWERQLKPLLLSKYPDTISDQLIEAHAYAYGGSVIQYIGYYPFGNKHFSELVHYVRSGDFVANMLKGAQDVNEYAFSLGALVFGDMPVDHVTTLQRVSQFDLQTIVPGHGEVLHGKEYVYLLIDLMKAVNAEVEKELNAGATTSDEIEQALPKAIGLDKWGEKFVSPDSANASFFDASFRGLMLASFEQVGTR